MSSNSKLKTPLFSKCKFCRKDKELIACNDCGFNSLINKMPNIFESTVLDELKPELEFIRIEIENLKNELRSMKIRGLKIKSVKYDG